MHAGASSQASGSRVGLEALCARQDAMDVAEFARSEQAGAGGALLDAYRSGDAGAVRRCAAGPLFCDLDNQVSGIAGRSAHTAPCLRAAVARCYVHNILWNNGHWWRRAPAWHCLGCVCTHVRGDCTQSIALCTSFV